MKNYNAEMVKNETVSSTKTIESANNYPAYIGLDVHSQSRLPNTTPYPKECNQIQVFGELYFTIGVSLDTD